MMTREQKINYLERYGNIQHAIKGIEWQIEKYEAQLAECRESMINPSVKMDGMPHGSPTDPMVNYAVRIEEIANKIQAEVWKRTRKIEELIAERRKIERNLELMDNSKYANLLWLYYIDGRTWADVAEVLGYTERNIYYMYERALRQFRKKAF